jgi:hypothetical protein
VPSGPSLQPNSPTNWSAAIRAPFASKRLVNDCACVATSGRKDS